MRDRQGVGGPYIDKPPAAFTSPDDGIGSPERGEDDSAPGTEAPEPPGFSEGPQPDPDRPAGPSGSGGASYELSIVMRHLDEAVAVLTELLKVLRETPSLVGADGPQQATAAEELLPVVQEQLEDCRAFGQGGSGQAPAAGASLATSNAAIVATAKRWKKRWPNEWWLKVWDAVKSSASWLAPAICRLTYVREWPLTGQVAVPGFAQASVSVTFATPPDTHATTLSRQTLRRPETNSGNEANSPAARTKPLRAPQGPASPRRTPRSASMLGSTHGFAASWRHSPPAATDIVVTFPLTLS